MKEVALDVVVVVNMQLSSKLPSAARSGLFASCFNFTSRKNIVL